MSRDRGLNVTLFAYNDLIWTLLACFMVLVVVLVTQVQQKKTEQADRPAGQASLYVFWPDGLAVDIDTHVLLPSGEHVFYRHQQGKTANLLRDDLGMNGDTTQKNFENIFFRDLPAGEYIVNIHAFLGSRDKFPVQVEAELNFLGYSSQVRFTQRLTMLREGDEITAFRFTIGQDGRLVPGSMSNLQSPFIYEK